MKVQIARAAVSDLARIGRYSRANWGDAQARRYRDALKARLRWLTRNQSLWRARDDLGPGIFSCLEGSHVVIFRKADDAIQILRILHVKMDPKRHLHLD